MRKIFVILTLILLLISCSSDDNSSNNNSSGNVDYEFTITVNGIAHKIKGNTATGYNGDSNNTDNACRSWITGGLHGVFLSIVDITEPNYVSGGDIYCNISLPSSTVGVQQAEIIFSGGFWNSFLTSIGSAAPIFTTTNGLSTSPTQTYLSTRNRVPLSITDLGTQTTFDSSSGGYLFGDTIKGSYSGVVYFVPSGTSIHSLPVQLSIDFKAIRFY